MVRKTNLNTNEGEGQKSKIDNTSESPTLIIMDIITRKGGVVMYSDPHIPEVTTHSHASLQSKQLTADNLQNADCVVLTTNHDAFDIEFIQKYSSMIVDLRNMIKDASGKVYKL